MGNYINGRWGGQFMNRIDELINSWQFTRAFNEFWKKRMKLSVIHMKTLTNR